MSFSADQWIASKSCEFRWLARVGPLGAVRVTDALVSGSPVGSVNLFGLFPLARADATEALLKGELLRYLAELPWCPDAIVSNPALRWEVVDKGCLRIGASCGPVDAQLDLHLDDDGLPARIRAIRPAEEGGQFTDREWQGTFCDYRRVEGRLIPHAARVWWTIDDAPFDVWRGSLENWSSAAR